MIFHPTSKDNIFHLAPIPVYKRVFKNDVITSMAYDFGLEILDTEQKQMGQELPGQYDLDRQSNYEVNYDRKDEWVENHELQPIGSRFYVKPNDFLEAENYQVEVIKRRIEAGFKELVGEDGLITESWLQYYEPTKGRGHNAHNHNRWQHGEEKSKMYSGGYYLSDGDPIMDHPYSGVFAFHVRGSKYFIRPKAGMLLIWPHDIIHSVEPFYGATHRAVINFNIQVK
tara:strand:- start:274 stop:954 length:681 start_codon:yes stop_codon:yes gene_type:complete